MPLIRTSQPGSVKLTGERIAKTLDEEGSCLTSMSSSHWISVAFRCSNLQRIDTRSKNWPRWLTSRGMVPRRFPSQDHERGQEQQDEENPSSRQELRGKAIRGFLLYPLSSLWSVSLVKVSWPFVPSLIVMLLAQQSVTFASCDPAPLVLGAGETQALQEDGRLVAIQRRSAFAHATVRRRPW